MSGTGFGRLSYCSRKDFRRNSARTTSLRMPSSVIDSPSAVTAMRSSHSSRARFYGDEYRKIIVPSLSATSE